MRIIAGDVGGTKTLLQMREYSGGEWQIVLERRYESASYPNLTAMVKEFVAIAATPVSCATIAVAGPIVGRRAHVTNLAWDIDAEEIARAVSISRVLLINDFFAVAAGVPLLAAEDLINVHRGERDASSPIALLGAGTGLGEATVLPTPTGWQVIPSEGGHADFAPTDEVQARLFEFLRRRYGHVSYERILSGPGLVNVYTFLRDETPQREQPLNEDEDLAAQIAKMATAGDPLAKRAMDIFISVFAAEAGNAGLRSIARGGIYIAGGIAAKNVSRFTDGRFVEVFLEKGRMRHLMERMPVDIIINQKVGLIGAANLAARAAASL